MPRRSSPPRVALVHDYLAEYGGAERVLEALHRLFPTAPVYTAFLDRERLGIQWRHFADWQLFTTRLSRIPFHRRLFSPLRLFAPHFFRQLDLSHYDLVISSTNAYFAKAVTLGPQTVHLCYCHTPSRSLWGYPTMSNWKKNPLVRIGGELINHYLRVKDVEIARGNVTEFIANSQETARRIKKFYKRDATVIYPPVVGAPIKTLMPASKRGYWLYVNRLGLAKHPELAVEACTQLGLPLKVVGDGPLLPQLRRLAGPTIEFLGFVSDEQLATFYAGAKALLYPVQDEDFGMVPVEAMQFGVPVLAHRSGGPLETVQAGRSGFFFDQLTVQALSEVIRRAQKNPFPPAQVAATTRRFAETQFARRFRQLLNRYQLGSSLS